MDLQERCFSHDPSRLDNYREKTWILYLLGHLKEKLLHSLSGRDIGIDPFVYPHGQGPDTILFFGRSKLPAYFEINDNGLLNLKVNLAGLTTREKEERVRKAEKYYQYLLEGYAPKLNERKLNATRNSRTIMSFDIGLKRQNGNLFYSSNDNHPSPEKYTVGRLTEILEKFYGSPPFEQIDIDPKEHPPHF